MIYEICAIKGDFASRLEGIPSPQKSTWNTIQTNGHHGASPSWCIDWSSFVPQVQFFIPWGVKTSRHANRIVREPKKCRRYKKRLAPEIDGSIMCFVFVVIVLYVSRCLMEIFDSSICDICSIVKGVWNKDCRYGSSNIRLSGEWARDTHESRTHLVWIRGDAIVKADFRSKCCGVAGGDMKNRQISVARCLI